MAFDNTDGFGFYLSGAGGDHGKECGDTTWHKHHIYGFIRNWIKNGELYGRFYHTEDKKSWTYHDAKKIKLESLSQVNGN